ncbi:MAG: FG-GAP repeat domain-containing protein [Armatimonadota bacterium]
MDGGITVERHTIAELGEEHFANCVLRMGREGNYAVAWGDRIIQMPLEPGAAVREVVQALPDQRYSNGGCALDVNGDGADEIVVARGPVPGTEPENPSIDLLWFEDVPGEETWREHLAATIPVANAWQAPHDIVPFRASIGGGIAGVAVVVGRQTLAWYERPQLPGTRWPRHEIGTLPAEGQSGMSVGDIAGNARPDIICGMFWAECPDDPRVDGWTLRRYGDFDANGWGGMAKTAVADIDGDGRAEIIATEAEIPDGRLAVFRRTGAASGQDWECRVLDHALYAPHSLVVTDIDGDGVPDIVVGEMECGGWDFPRHDNPRIMAWLQRDELRFEQVTLAEHAGIHEMELAPGMAGETVLFGCDETQPHKLEGLETTVYMLRVNA